MSRSIVLSNGELCVALDRFGEVRDLYYPHVGSEDHVRGHYVHHVGIWVDGTVSWLDEDPLWQIEVGCEEDALASNIVARHPQLMVELAFTDIVFNEQPIFFRRVSIINHSEHAREMKLYFGQQFEIYKTHGGDTAYFDPAINAVIHYKGRRVFLISASIDGDPFQDYAIGIANFHGKEGAWRDADDGQLSKNPIEHGPVDSVIGVYGTVGPGESRLCHYWIAAAQSIPDARELNHYVLTKTPEHLIENAREHWRTWLSGKLVDFADLDRGHIALYKRSLMHIKAHADQDGGILASLDSDMLQYGLDTYSYVWPRDGAYVALAMTAAGDTTIAKRFLEFCRGAISPEGYLMHKYLPDGSLGSSWHPWVKDGHPQLPIQEDETALTLVVMADYYRRTRDLEFLEMYYHSLVEKAARFLLLYRDKESNLPEPSYDLWEERRGVSTFTTAAVYAGLASAAELAGVLGKHDDEKLFADTAAQVHSAILERLWDEKTGVFMRAQNDTTIDASSAWAAYSFGILWPDDERLQRAWEVTARRLSQGIEAGGLARYEGDQYYRNNPVPAGNPWIITTLWYADYLAARAKDVSELDRVRTIFTWTVKHANAAGVLPEQLDPKTGAALSATPLAWSHAVYVAAVLKYLERRRELSAH